jgi:hypothetical protein
MSAVPELPVAHELARQIKRESVMTGTPFQVIANVSIELEAAEYGDHLYWTDWLAACDGCTAESVVAKMREAGR